ncbi:RRN11 [Candida theae]|uniref:RRN11 n=1 Tax=Candida theae TaxID=1198502 RepID=A0AAD5B9X1_9ASCO|nr:RRN11 [Candida theae]KAI5948651.1 RRN11 [Candida theae]
MIFEDITDTDHKLRRTRRNTTQLISKYVEIKRFQNIYDTSSSLQKRKLRHPEVKRFVLRLIHKHIHRRMKPEETFEVWHKSVTYEERKSKQNAKKKSKATKKQRYEDQQFENDRLNSEVYEFLDTEVPDNLNDNDVEFDLQMDDNLDDDEAYEEYDIISTAKLDQLTKEFDTQNTFTKTQFLIESNGLEILPDQRGITTHSILNQHLNNLNTLLHTNILRQNWKISYRLFCIIIRFPMVDIRQVWPLGIEILTHLDTKHKSTPAKIKITKFFNYLNSFYTVSYRNTISIERSDRSSIAPAWRTGTRSLTPMYLINSLWHLFVQQEYEQILNKILELILEPPYHKEGVLYFIVALCYLCQCCDAVNHFALQHDLDKFNETGATYRSMKECLNYLNSNWSKIEANVKKCKEFEFELPVLELKSQWQMIVEKLYETEKSVGNRKFETAVDAIVDIIPEGDDDDGDVGAGDDWGDIESDKEDMVPQLDTSFQNKVNGVHKGEHIPHYEDNGDNNMDDDWSQIQSDFEEDEQEDENSGKQLANTTVEEKTGALVDYNNEWDEISSDSEEEKESSGELEDTREIEMKPLYNETPTQHDSVLLNSNDTLLINHEHDSEDINNGMDLGLDGDRASIESDPDEMENERAVHKETSLKGENSNGLDSAIAYDNMVANSMKQVNDSYSTSQREDNHATYDLKWPQGNDTDIDPSQVEVSLDNKLVDCTFDGDDTVADEAPLTGFKNTADTQQGKYDLEWPKLDEYMSVHSSPNLSETNGEGSSDELSTASVGEKTRNEDDWDLEWSLIDDDVILPDTDQTTTIPTANGEKVESSNDSGAGPAHPFESKPTHDTSVVHPVAHASDSTALTMDNADESIEDSILSSFDFRRNSLELHQSRLKSEKKSILTKELKLKKSKNKSKSKSKIDGSGIRISKEPHSKEKKRKTDKKRQKR